MPIKLEITLMDDGQMSVTGPFDQELLCYGMIEKAKVVIGDAIKAAAAKIQAPGPQAVRQFGHKETH